MIKKLTEIIKKDIKLIQDIYSLIINIDDPNISDFQFCSKKLNKLENDIFKLSNIEDIDIISSLKKIMYLIEKNNSFFYEARFLILNSIRNLEKLYVSYSLYGIDTNNSEILKFEKILKENDTELIKLINSKNKDKNYYYIKFKLDTTVNFFYLSRRIILSRLLEFGKAYNYTPTLLDDDVFEYFILDYRVNSDIDIYSLLDSIKKDDDAILGFEIIKIESTNNIYNLKFFVNKDVNETSCLLFNNFKFIDLIHYENYYDTFVEAKNQKSIIEELIRTKNNDLLLISLKKINERELKIFLPAGINKLNISDIKKIIASNINDKTIDEILYSGSIDFLGLQMLEYLRKKYTIEYGG